MSGDGSFDHYALLGVEDGVGPSELRRAWRRLALRWHPDRAGDSATARFQSLAAAYAVLSSPAARAEYDRRRGVAARPQATAADPPPQQRRAPSVMLSRVCGPLNALLACGIAARAEPGVIELFLKTEELSEGGMAAISLRVPVRCASCSGAACARCGGSGTTKELFTAWLAVRPGVAEGTLLAPSVALRGMIQPVQFRVRARP